MKIAHGAKNFFPHTVTKNIYATGWDGDMVVNASLDASFTVDAAGFKPAQ